MRRTARLPLVGPRGTTELKLLNIKTSYEGKHCKSATKLASRWSALGEPRPLQTVKNQNIL